MRTHRLLILALILIGWAPAWGASAPKKEKRKSAPAKVDSSEREFDLSRASFQEILDRYVFVADFNQKAPERPVSKEPFWKYPFKLPPVKFDLDLDSVNMRELIFQVKGEGRKTEIINVGRAAFMEGDHKKAHEVWLAARGKFHDDATTNKILEFFMGVNALTMYKQKFVEVKGDVENLELKALQQVAAYFFAAGFILHKDVPEPRIDPMAPWALYNLAVVYFRFQRMPSVYGAASEGLAALIKAGKTNYRSEFRQLLAEAHIKNQDLISAIQELDTAIRQDPDRKQAARMFYRAGDIYFDLNNYELAEDLYAMASAIDRESQVYNPAQALLRAESVFWLGRFEDAERLLRGAVDYAMRVAGNEWLQESKTMPWAILRAGDTWLARAAQVSAKARQDYLEKARLTYFKLQMDFPRSDAARIADVRSACLEMPGYQGSNVKHGREIFADVKEKKDVPEVLMELVWACDAGSYSDREKSDLMVAKVKEFSEKYPHSKFLDTMLPPVREVQASKIQEYFDSKQWDNATSFFEQKRAALYPAISKELAGNLWVAYVATSRPDQALEFWGKTKRTFSTDKEALRMAAFLYESSSAKNDAKLAKDRDALDAALLKRVWGKNPDKEEVEYLGRVLATRSAAKSYAWVLRLQDAWTSGDDSAACGVLFPLLSRLNADKNSSAAVKREVYQRTKSFSASKLAELREKDKGCFQSWIDLESKILTTRDLDAAYGKRQEWPLEGAWLERVWSWSESLSARGQKTEATALWRSIAEKGSKDSFEARMAKARLDPQKTEFESLWK